MVGTSPRLRSIACFFLTIFIAVLADDEPPTVGGLFESAIESGKFVADLLVSGNIAKMAFTLFLYSMNKYLGTQEAVGK